MSKKLKEDSQATTVEVVTGERVVHLDIEELKAVKPYVGDQTRIFDYRMIEQNDAIVAFVPEYRGEGYRAEGVFYEMAYAGYKGKEIYLIWPAGDSPSLMVEVDRPPFDTIDEAVSFFGN